LKNTDVQIIIVQTLKYFIIISLISFGVEVVGLALFQKTAFEFAVSNWAKNRFTIKSTLISIGISFALAFFQYNKRKI
jgi:uncharacterized membrane protein YidH (DUF202 family)